MVASVCAVSLVEQASRAPCTIDETFGCQNLQDGPAIWVRNCRGTFRCANSTVDVKCGFPPGREQYNCACSGTGDATLSTAFLALGGSNTCAHGLTGSERSYADLTANALRISGAVDGLVNNCVAAAGPTFAAACMSRYVPTSAKFATVEYLPNMGFAESTGVEYRAVDALLQRLRALEVRVVVVNLYVTAGYKNWQQFTKRPMLETTHRKLLRLAAKHGAQSLTVNFSSPAQRGLFAHDNHLNARGHQFVHTELMRLFAEPPLAGKGGNDRAPQALTSTQCALGDELKPYVGHRSSFSKVNLCKAKGCKKVTWEAQAPGARLALCLNHSAMPPETRYRVALGFQTSHRQNLPLFGEARLRCSGGCACNNATFNTLTDDHVTVTRFVSLDVGVQQPIRLHSSSRTHCAPSQCTIVVSNSHVADEPHRLELRALIAGPRSPGFSYFFSEMLAATRNAPQQWRR